MSDVIGAVREAALVETYTDNNGDIRVLDSFRITPSFGVVYYQGLDVGFPVTRASVQDNPQADGTFDETKYTGARSISLTGAIRNNAFQGLDISGWSPEVGWNYSSWWVKYLSGWASPARRFRLYVTDEGGTSRFCHVRGDSFSAPIGQEAAHYRPFQMGLINPDGRWYSFNTTSSATVDGRNKWTVSQYSDSGQPGRVYPEPGPYNRSYPALLGADAFVYKGTVSTTFIAKVHIPEGTLTAPRIAITGPDGVTQSVGLSNAVTFNAGSVITFDSEAKTVTQDDGIPLDAYKTAPLQWPRLKPGLRIGDAPGFNRVAFTAESADPSVYAEIIFNDADLM